MLTGASHFCIYDLRQVPKRALVKRFDYRADWLITKVRCTPCLRYEPDKTSKSRIKRLRGLISPQYRLRVDEHRLFYDIEYRVEPDNHRVIILAIKHKSDVNEWLEEGGVSDETDTTE
jgi:mRNA-degrading endonuclease RelE of RelBE toxin-antitoxin system